MTKTTSIDFARRYRAVLRAHFQRRVRDGVGSPRARALGRAAEALGLDCRALARIHFSAVAELAALSPQTKPGARAPIPVAAGRFLAEALRPIAQAAHAARLQVRRLGSLRVRRARSDAALQRSRVKLRREIARRKRCEHRLLQSLRHYHFLLAQARRTQKQSRSLAHRILIVQEEERKTVSRDLHDEVAQILAGINVHLAAVYEEAARNGRSLPQRIAQTQRIVTHSIEAVHRYARELRPTLLDDLGLIPALRSFIRGIHAQHGLRVHFSAFPEVETLDNPHRTVLYRVAQEALTNVVRHARASRATVRIRQVGTNAVLTIRDDGRAFVVSRVLAASSHKRLGLLGMRERVEMVGGTFRVRSSPGRGTTVRAEISFGPKKAAPRHR